MKEISEILKAFDKAKLENKKTALATVVKVEGSSYRRPGARMLIREDGQLTGAISGGCLEGDALRKARAAMHFQEKRLVTYDTTDGEDTLFGVQLGCNGIVYILIEPMTSEELEHPIRLLRKLNESREPAVLAVLFSLYDQRQIGSYSLLRENSYMNRRAETFDQQVLEDSTFALQAESSKNCSYQNQNLEITGLLEFIVPPISLIIAGAGNDAKPLAVMADLLGWTVTVVDGRPIYANAQRFVTVQNILTAKPAEAFSQMIIDDRTAFVLMTHNYNYDLDMLSRLLPSDAPYIGILGPKKKLLKMLEELQADTNENRSRIHGPVGMDIGAETAEEIAVSIIAEIQACMSGAAAGHLKEKGSAIHNNPLKQLT